MDQHVALKVQRICSFETQFSNKGFHYSRRKNSSHFTIAFLTVHKITSLFYCGWIHSKGSKECYGCSHHTYCEDVIKNVSYFAICCSNKAIEHSTDKAPNIPEGYNSQ